MFIMNPCLICLETTNKLFENENCKCKYNVHQNCLSQWSNKWNNNCIICKATIINKQSWIYKLRTTEWTNNWIVSPILQLAFIPMLITYQCFINTVYLFNVYVLESYENVGR